MTNKQVNDLLKGDIPGTARHTIKEQQTEIARLKAKLELCREGLQQAGWNATRLRCDCANRPNEAIVCERCRIRIAVDKALAAIEGSNDNDKL